MPDPFREPDGELLDLYYCHYIDGIGLEGMFEEYIQDVVWSKAL